MFTKNELNDLVAGTPQEKADKAKAFFFPSGKADIDRIAAVLSLLLDVNKSALRDWMDLQNFS